MRDSFDSALGFTLKWEGGYVNDPVDPGGETNMGISKRAYPDEDIKNMTRERAAELYLKDYWIKAGCDDIIFPDDIAVFDTAVNCGVSRAKKWYWQSGNWGTLLAIREHYYNTLVEKKPTMKKFLRGWMNRVNDLLRFCRELECAKYDR